MPKIPHSAHSAFFILGGNSKASEGIEKNQKKGGKAKLWEGLKRNQNKAKRQERLRINI